MSIDLSLLTHPGQRPQGLERLFSTNAMLAYIHKFVIFVSLCITHVGMRCVYMDQAKLHPLTLLLLDFWRPPLEIQPLSQGRCPTP